MSRDALVQPYESDAAFEIRLQRRIRHIILFSVALIIVIIFAFPIYFMVSSSFKAEHEMFATPPHWIPEDFQGLGNYARAFDIEPVGRWLFNSFLVAAIQVGGTILFGAAAGYGFAKFDFPGRRIMFFLTVSIMAVPFQVLVIPMVVLVRQLGMNNSYLGLIMPGLISAFGVFMMRQFAFGIPDELLDAARIDGASEPKIFWSIVMPLLRPAAASLAIITFLFSWNSYLWPLVIVQNKELMTLPVGLTFFTQDNQGPLPTWATAMAVSTLATLPVALIFVRFQRYFVEGMMVSGIKG